MSSTRKKGFYTIKITSVLFALSVLTELLNITADTPFFGIYFSGWVAVIRHLIYISVYALISMSLWYGKVWTPRIVYGGAVFCILDAIGYFLAREEMVTRVFDDLSKYGDLSLVIDRSQVLTVVKFYSFLLIAGWLGFALYIHIRRSYFLDESEEISENDEFNAYD